jgi:hypothetical protein
MTSCPRVMFVTPSAYTLSGLATWLNYLLPGLAEMGWHVPLGLVSGPRHHLPQAYLAAHPYSDVEVIHCVCSTAGGRVSAVRAAIKKLSPGIVISVNIPDAIKAAALERLKGRDVRAVMSCHGIQEDLFNDMRLLQDDLDAVVCTNRLACRLASTVGGIDRDRVFHCAYGTSVPSELPTKQANSIFTIGYSGRLEQPQKRVHDLVEIGLCLRDRGLPFRMLIAGSGPEEAALRQRVDACGLTEELEWLGFVASHELERRLYQASDALLVTSSWETGPIVIWEAMAAGTPVVTSRYTGSGFEGLLENTKNCLMYDIGDVHAASDSLQRLHQDAVLGETIRAAAFQTVTERLSHEVSVTHWDRILREIFSRAPKRCEVEKPLSDDGRLTRLVGPLAASRIRKLLRRLPPDSGPGGEWPHALSGAIMPEDDFLRMAATLDRRDETRILEE